MIVESKELRQKFGMLMSQIGCTKAYRRNMGFDHKSVTTSSYILINENSTKLPDGTPCSGSRVHVNLYNGVAGSGFNPDKSTYALGDPKTLAKKLKGYVEIPISDCPIAKGI